MTVGPGLQHFRTFLKRGADGITHETHLGAAIPRRFCPNFGFHFKPHVNLGPTFCQPHRAFPWSPLSHSRPATTNHHSGSTLRYVGSYTNYLDL
jgi:hypothetical protein